MSESPVGGPGVVAMCGWLLRYARRRWLGAAGVLAAMLLRIGVDLLKPWPMKLLVDHALGHQPLPAGLARVFGAVPGGVTPAALVVWAVLGTVGLFVLGWALTAGAAMVNLGFGQRLVYDLAADLYAHLQRLSLRYHSRRSVGDSIKRVTNDSSCISTIVRDALLPLVTSVVTLVLMFGILWRISWPLTLVALAVVPPILWVMRHFAAPMLELGYTRQEVDARIYEVVEQTFTALPVVQAFGREDETTGRLGAVTDESLAATLALTRVQVRYKLLIGLATALGTAAVMGLGGRQVLAGQLTVGSLLVFLAYLAALFAPIESIAYTSSTIQSAAGSARRVMEVLASEPEVVESPGARPVGHVRGEVRCEAVSFAYDPGRPVLQHVSFVAEPGQTIALVGPTGAGKSTLVSLLPRCYDPSAGRLTLDGVDLRELRLAELRDQLALVLQEPFLFPLTIAENIAYGRPNASLADIEAAARAAHAHEFIAQLPQGYETVVGERGATLSGGQRQRLSIARALLKDARLLVLDEPTSAVDAGTEAQITEALERLRAGRTCFIIAHRLSTIRSADRIVVLEQGRVVETGTHPELLAAGGLYARLHDQFTASQSDRRRTTGRPE